MTVNQISRKRQNRIDQGLLFCEFRLDWRVGKVGDVRWFSAWIWHEGGAIDGCHQPFTIDDIRESQSESTIRAMIERVYPGIIYREIPPEWQ